MCIRDRNIATYPLRGGTTAYSLLVYNNKLYSGLGGNGNLARYNIGGYFWKSVAKLYIAQDGNATWESVKDETWEDLAAENWDYSKQSWKVVI